VINSTAVGNLSDACSALTSKRLPLTESDVATLHSRINAAVDEMKAGGTSCERVIVAIKALMRDSALRWRTLDIRERLGSWTVERYYGQH
jgi:hypothetical protein